MENEIILLDSIETFNRVCGFETLHPLVAIVNMAEAKGNFGHARLNYGLYALWLKNGVGCRMKYGRRYYDYQEGTVVSLAPGQMVQTEPLDTAATPQAIGLLFHPDLIRGTFLGQHIHEYHFFDYASNEALHTSERERQTYIDCIAKIQQEVERPIDKFSRRLICQNIQLLLDYCLRFYDRQFITREDDNHDVIVRFEKELNEYFSNNSFMAAGIPTVKYFAEKCFLSPNYFGDLVKKETGKTPQEYIQAKVIDLAKELLMDTKLSVAQVADRLGFEYSQHFNRYFKRSVGLTPTEYRKQQAV